MAVWEVEPNVLRTLLFSHRGSPFEGGRFALAGPRENRLAGGHIERRQPGH